MRHENSHPWLQYHILLGATLALAVLTSGCDGGADFPSTAPVNGEITIDGQPVTGGRITFMPLPSGPAAFGVIDKDGHYELTTNTSLGKPDGAIICEHRVLIDGRPIVEPGQSAPPSQTPLVYADAKKTALRATVKAGQTNEINFSLNSKGQ